MLGWYLLRDLLAAGRRVGVLIRGARQRTAVLIAPPLSKHDYTDLAEIQCPLLVIVSENDFTLEPERLRSWIDRLSAPKQLVQAALDNHFFRGHEPWLESCLLIGVVERVAPSEEEQAIGASVDGLRNPRPPAPLVGRLQLGLY